MASLESSDGSSELVTRGSLLSGSSLESSVSSSRPPSRDSTTWAEPHEWENWRSTITELYAKNTLYQVVKLMKEKHGFVATQKMYKARLKNWGLSKNINPTFVAQSGTANEARLMFNGRRVTEKDIQRYMKRKRAQERFDSKDFSRNDLLALVTVPPTLQPTEPGFELMLFTIRDLFTGSLKSNLPQNVDRFVWPFRSISTDARAHTSDTWCIENKEADVSSLGESEYHEEAVLKFNLIIHETKGHLDYTIRFGNVHLFSNLLQKLCLFHDYLAVPGLLPTIAEHWRTLAAITLTERHPLIQFFACLPETDQKHIFEILQRSWEFLSNLTVQRLGKDHFWSALESLHYSYFNDQDHGHASREVLRTTCKSDGISQDRRLLDVARYESLHLLESGSIPAAEDAVRYMYLSAMQMNNALMRATYVSVVHLRTAHCRFASGDAESAVNHMSMALSLGPRGLMGGDWLAAQIWNSVSVWTHRWRDEGRDVQVFEPVVRL